MRESFSNLKEFAGDAEKYFLVKDKNNLVSIDKLPPIDISRACNVLMSKDSDEPYGFKHDELFHKNKEDGSLAIPNLVVSRNDTHTDIDGIDFQNSSVEIPNSYLGNSNNLITINHAGGGLISIGDASDTTTSQYGISNGFNLYSIGGGITFPDWDKFFEIDDYLGNASMPCQQNSYGLPSQTGCDTCESRASNHREWELNRMQNCSDHMMSKCGSPGEELDITISYENTGSYVLDQFPGYADPITGVGVGYSFSCSGVYESGVSEDCRQNYEVMFEFDPDTNMVPMIEIFSCGTIDSSATSMNCSPNEFNEDLHHSLQVLSIEVVSVSEGIDHLGGLTNLQVTPDGQISFDLGADDQNPNLQFSVKIKVGYQWIPQKLKDARFEIAYQHFKSLVDADNPWNSNEPSDADYLSGYFPCTPDISGSGSSTSITCNYDSSIQWNAENVQNASLLGFSLERVSDGALNVYSGEQTDMPSFNEIQGEVSGFFSSSPDGESFSSEAVIQYKQRVYNARKIQNSLGPYNQTYDIFYGSTASEPPLKVDSIPYTNATYTDWGCLVGPMTCPDPGPYSLGQGVEILWDNEYTPDTFCWDGSELDENKAYDECEASCKNNDSSRITKHWRFSSRNMGCENGGTVKVDATYDCGCGGDYITVDINEDHECGWKALMNR